MNNENNKKEKIIITETAEIPKDWIDDNLSGKMDDSEFSTLVHIKLLEKKLMHFNVDTDHLFGLIIGSILTDRYTKKKKQQIKEKIEQVRRAHNDVERNEEDKEKAISELDELLNEFVILVTKDEE
jgi:retron-type reverse transcriptase